MTPMVEETVLVTGGCGFIGQRLVRALKEAEHSVRVMDIPRADFTNAEAMGAKCFKGSVADGESVRVALGNARVVYHMVAPSIAIQDDKFIRSMVIAGAQVLMEEAEEARVEHVVAASTTGVYAQRDGVHAENAPLKPGNRLERAKLEMERSLTKASKASGIGVTILRLPNVYGAGDNGIVDLLAPEVVYHGNVTLPGKGWVNTVHADDVVDAAVHLAAAREGPGEEGTVEVFNCVDGRPHGPRELLDLIADTAEAPSPELKRPGLIGASRGRWANRDKCVRLVEKGRYSADRIQRRLRGWPSYPSMEEGLPPELEGSLLS